MGLCIDSFEIKGVIKLIDWLSNWAQVIIISVIIATIIEMILPEGSSKKYIKVVIGIYILFTIISPIISKFKGKEIAVSNILVLEEYMNEINKNENIQNLLQSNNYENIKEIYVENLKSDIKTKLIGRGYIVHSIELEVGEDENYTLRKIYLKVRKMERSQHQENKNSNIENINDITIQVSNTIYDTAKDDEEEKSDLSNDEKKKIKEYLSNVYEIHEKKIEIN